MARVSDEELAATAELERSRSPGFESASSAALSPSSAAHSGSGEFGRQRLRRRQASMGGDFITAAPESRQHEVDGSWSGSALRRATYIVENNYNTNILALVVLFDAYLTANDIDARAAGRETSAFIRTCSDICLLLYTAELPLLLFVRGRRIFKDWMVLLDLDSRFFSWLFASLCRHCTYMFKSFVPIHLKVIIMCGFAEWTLTIAGDALASRTCPEVQKGQLLLHGTRLFPLAWVMSSRV